MHNAYALVRVENCFSNHRSNQLAISWNVNSFRFLSSLPDASGKSLLRKLGFGYMLSPMVAYTSRIIMQTIPARVIVWRLPSLGKLCVRGRCHSPVTFVHAQCPQSSVNLVQRYCSTRWNKSDDWSRILQKYLRWSNSILILCGVMINYFEPANIPTILKLF